MSPLLTVLGEEAQSEVIQGKKNIGWKSALG